MGRREEEEEEEEEGTVRLRMGVEWAEEVEEELVRKRERGEGRAREEVEVQVEAMLEGRKRGWEIAVEEGGEEGESLDLGPATRDDLGLEVEGEA